MSNREVAEALAIQEKTVKHYMTAILEKLQARNRVEAALIARDAWGDPDAERHPPSGGCLSSRGGGQRLAIAVSRARSAAVAVRSTTVLLFGSFSS